jgi:hypothetical protein
MMNNKFNSLTVKLFTLIIGIFLAVTLPGCIDPIVSDLDAEHQRLGEIVKQDLQQSPFNNQRDSISQKFYETGIQTSPQSKTLYPAP